MVGREEATWMWSDPGEKSFIQGRKPAVEERRVKRGEPEEC